MVHQHFSLVYPFTVAENVILGQEGGLVLHPEEAERQVAELADAYGFRVGARRRRGDALGGRAAARRDPEGALSEAWTS